MYDYGSSTWNVDMTALDGNMTFAGLVQSATTGNFKLGAGESAASPPYAFYSDSNTGMYRVANGKLGIVGVGSLVATFDGNTDRVGIGVQDPDNTLEVNGDISTSTTNQAIMARYSNNNLYAALLGWSSVADGCILQLGNNNANNEIRAGHTSTGGGLKIITNNTADYTAVHNGTVALAFTSAGNATFGGNIGIPNGYKIHGDSATLGYVRLGSSHGAKLGYDGGNGNTYFNAGNGNIDIGAGGSSALAIDSSRNSTFGGDVKGGSFRTSKGTLELANDTWSGDIYVPKIGSNNSCYLFIASIDESGADTRNHHIVDLVTRTESTDCEIDHLATADEMESRVGGSSSAYQVKHTMGSTITVTWSVVKLGDN
tara:strand:- start:16 stop:1128 length:1113 start_codon:yes stop_codon:yes gene_type:complete